MQRALVGATEGIAWELLWALTSIKQNQGKPQSLTDMVNKALPAALKGMSRKALSLEGVQSSLQVDSSVQQLTNRPKLPGSSTIARRCTNCPHDSVCAQTLSMWCRVTITAEFFSGS